MLTCPVLFKQEEPVLPRVPFASCLDRWASTGEINDYFSASLGRRTSGLHRTRMASFPPYLMVQLKRYSHQVSLHCVCRSIVPDNQTLRKGVVVVVCL